MATIIRNVSHNAIWKLQLSTWEDKRAIWKFEIEPNGLNLELRQQIKILLRQLDFISPLEYNVTKINYWITQRRQAYDSAIVTSTSTPGSMVIEVICFTTSEELTRSITLLCTRSSNRSHVLVPANNKENKKEVIIKFHKNSWPHHK